MNMFRYLPFFRLILLSALVSLFAPTFAQSYSVDALSHAAVQIEVPNSTGSGTLVLHENRALVLTNRHVVENYSEATINVLLDVTEPAVPFFKAELRGFAMNYDFAVLELMHVIREKDESEPFELEKLLAGDYGFQLPRIELDATLTVGRGETIAVFGYPGLFDRELIYTTGIIASLQYGSFNDQRLPMWYRTSAEMSSGNSGGLAVNAQGQFIGIPTSVAQEHETGGRLGNLLALPFALALMDDPEEMSTDWALYRQTHALELDTSAPAVFGSVSLSASSLATSNLVELTSGGTVPVNYLGDECVGFAAIAADYQLTLIESINTLWIQFTAERSRDDTTLVIRAPDGSWHCNDDAIGLHPGVAITDASEGDYLIWVGSFSEGDYHAGNLQFSNRTLNPHDSYHPNESLFSVDDKAEINTSATALFGHGEFPESQSVIHESIRSAAGGVVNMTNFPMGNCAGFTSIAPSYSFLWQHDEQRPLFVQYRATVPEHDALLYVLAPNGQWFCNDDAHNQTLNPEVVFKQPQHGLYRVWLGTFRSGVQVDGHLQISNQHQPLN